MRRTLPGVRQPRLGRPWHLSDHLPDPRRPAIRDTGDRNVFFKTNLESAHTTLSVSDAQTFYFTEPTRIRTVEVAGVSGGTVTVQVTVEGGDIFADAARPVSDAGPSDASDVFIAPAGTVIQTVIEGTTGTPTGTANVVLDAEAYVILERRGRITLTGRDRLKVSKRFSAQIANEDGHPGEAQRLGRLYGYTSVWSSDPSGVTVDAEGPYVPENISTETARTTGRRTGGTWGSNTSIRLQ